MEELNVAVKELQSKVTALEIEVVSVKTKQIALDDNFTSIEKNTVFVDEQVQELTTKAYKNSNDVSDTNRKLMYLEAYSRRENLKFEGIPETFGMRKEDGAIQRGERCTENTKAVLTQFLDQPLQPAILNFVTKIISMKVDISIRILIDFCLRNSDNIRSSFYC